MNILGSSSRFLHPPSLWATSMTSWLSWPSSERSPTPLMVLYGPFQSWTSLTSHLSSNPFETWTRHVSTCPLRPPRFLRPQRHLEPHKGRPHPHHPLPLPPHLPIRRIGAPIALNVTSAPAWATWRLSASSRRSCSVKWLSLRLLQLPLPLPHLRTLPKCPQKLHRLHLSPQQVLFTLPPLFFFFF